MQSIHCRTPIPRGQPLVFSRQKCSHSIRHPEAGGVISSFQRTVGPIRKTSMIPASAIGRPL
ncbi:hypothetical protein AB205_0089300 [Aquarana catesbeiana]|uniref:Uncharacterized protein n=1 Tax=Aquarana catesbeiana TaxID=8400 RepID=A0A2G9RUS4_AQUCT|nr:hypothetical protein AB205_0089300 [Aquarana catesbeiana]